jgi:hypothetical protein
MTTEKSTKKRKPEGPTTSGRKTATSKRTARQRTKNTADPEQPPNELERKLLTFGGERLIRQPHYDNFAAEVLERGHVFDLPVVEVPGEPHHSPANAAELWGNDIGRFALCTGYALDRGDGLWFAHAWVVADGQLYETTERRDLYFGV